jgi:hypothetical protein
VSKRIGRRRAAAFHAPQPVTIIGSTGDDDPLGTALPFQDLAQESLSRSQIPPFAEPKFDRITVAVDRAVGIPPLASDPDICLVNMPLARDGSLARIEPLQQFG